MSNRPPNYPVIVTHLDDGNGYTACSGHPMPLKVEPQHAHVPRYLCIACARYEVRGD